MSLILNIDTSTEKASICLAEAGHPFGLRLNPDQKDHASWMHVAIDEALKDAGRLITDLKAIAITAGPGSYTGLRVSMAAAKGLCYALQIPLIGVNTLEAMAFAMRNAPQDYLCPMIDARRMEVFTAIYTKELEVILQPRAMILEQYQFSEYMKDNSLLFFGNGSEKFKPLAQNTHAFFSETTFNASHMAQLTDKKFLESDFTPLAYSEPVYIKDFYMPGFPS